MQLSEELRHRIATQQALTEYVRGQEEEKKAKEAFWYGKKTTNLKDALTLHYAQAQNKRRR